MFYSSPVYKEGQRLTANDLNVMLHEVVRRTKLFAQPPLFLQDGPGGATLTYSDNKWFGVLCGTKGDGYAVCEVVPDLGGNWELLDGGRSGIAYEFNFTSAIPPGKVVRIYPGFNGEYIFECYATDVMFPIDCECCGSSCSSDCSSSSSDSSDSSSESSGSSDSSSESSDSSDSSDCSTSSESFSSSSASYGCGLEFTDGVLSVNPFDLAGSGLEVEDEDDCALKVNTGCGLTVNDDNEVVVVPADIAGPGLTTYEGDDCDQLTVDTGCGLTIDEDGFVVLDYDNLVGKGLEINSDDADCPFIEAAIGCGLKFDADDKIANDYDKWVGHGLTVVNFEDACSEVDVKPSPGGCLKVDATGVSVDLTPINGPTFSCLTAMGPSGCGVSYTVVPVTFKTNACGLFLGLEIGEGVTHNFNLCAACQNCSSSSSSSAPSYCCWDGECLQATITNTTGTCDCLEGLTFNLFYSDEFLSWSGTATSECGEGCEVEVEVSCDTDTGWQLDTFLASGEEYPLAASGVICDPLSVRFDVSNITECCSGDCTIFISPCQSSSSSHSSYSSTSCSGETDMGCGQQGWLIAGGDIPGTGFWVWDGEISCSCGTPVYPYSADGPEGTHTTTYCCPNSGSSSSSSDSCTGWYCCQQTDTVAFLANCAAKAEYSCASDV